MPVGSFGSSDEDDLELEYLNPGIPSSSEPPLGIDSEDSPIAPVTGANSSGPFISPFSVDEDEYFEERRSLLTSHRGSTFRKGHKMGTKFDAFIKKIEVDNEAGLTSRQLFLLNDDLKPVEPARRKWQWFNFVFFWVADSFNVNTWMIGASTIVGFGLNWWQAWLTVWVGYFIAGCFICLTGRIGAMYHISFPVVARSSFGIWGSLWPVFNRAAMACIWYGVQAWIGGTCVYLMIRSIWNSWDNIPDTIHAKPGSLLNTRDFVSFFLFWLCSLPAIWFPVHQIRHLFTVKSYVVPVAGIAFLIWSLVRAGGIGGIVHKPAKATGSDLAWGVIQGIMSSIANFATLIVNDPDFSRFAKKPKDALWSQLITIPTGFALTSLIGILTTSACTVIYGKEIWNPLDLLKYFLDDGGTGARVGVFFISMSFALAQLGTNIAANSVSAGTDMTALLPRFLNIRRGGYICAAVGIAMCPWNLLESTNSFTTYLSAYSVFLSSIAGVLISDYYFVRKGYLQIKDLYSGKSTGPYYYTFGFNWRGYTAYICGILPNIVGFVGAIGKDVPIGATYIYRLNFFAGFIASSGIYWLVNHFFPVPGCADTWNEVGDEITEVILAEDSDSTYYDEEQAHGKVPPTADEKAVY
ncbi:hypothetical protein H072_2984 [Dactylellina haptotyla CBS 200.50]|uniref:Uracil permease n=1 Tax=Dactylellina haptotyla (strain CBS 200.50) TaxID=1284197 RepID=S8AJ69_DACHA|nr:hypothetical protein H072_2984 [Dactylellina haptotyla CBS 200.50]